MSVLIQVSHLELENTHTQTQQPKHERGHFLRVEGGYLLLMRRSVMPHNNTQNNPMFLLERGWLSIIS